MLLITLISIILVVVILIVLIWTLINLNKEMQEKIKREIEKFDRYQTDLKKLEKSALSEDDLETLHKLARSFFKERYNLKYNLTYLELAQKFKKGKKQEHAQFANLMSDLIYSGKKINSRKIRKAADLFSVILKSDI